MTLYELSRMIADERKRGNYAKMLQIFKEQKGSFTTEQIASNIYIISDILTALRKSGHSASADAFLFHHGIPLAETTDERILNAYGWSIYDCYKKDHEAPGRFNAYQFLRQVEKLIPLLQKNPTPYSQTLLSRMLGMVLKTEKHKASVNWRFIDDFCNLFDPSQLSTRCETIEVERKGRMKKMELASDRENWYAAKSKALMELGEMEACFNYSKQALEEIRHFHYANDLWFARRIALAKKSFGDIDTAIAELEKILGKKREWFLQRELAELYLEKEEIDKAFDYAMRAMNNHGVIEYKVGLLELIGEILARRNDPDNSQDHYRLAVAIRDQNGWKIPQTLSQKISNPQERVEYTLLKRKLEEYWKSFRKKEKEEPLLSGIVKVILHSNEKGKDGFISGGGGEDYYFSLPASIGLTSKVESGIAVKFAIQEQTEEGRRSKVKIVKIAS